MKIATAALDTQSHYFWKAHADVLSRTTPSVLPCDLVYLILRFVPTWTYCNAYDPEDESDCESQYDPWQRPDLDEPRAFGDY